MPEITRNRTIRTSTRLEKSKSYKINTKQVGRGDTLIVNIDHESKAFYKTFRFKGADVAHKDSISFRVNDVGGKAIDIQWSGAQPIGSTSSQKKADKTHRKKQKKPSSPNNGKSKNVKQGLDPIANSETEVLILGTLPGDKSLELSEYYANPGNRFWKVIAEITNNEVPADYEGKKELLLSHKIGVWDVAHKADRKGSLDSSMKDEEPNDLETFMGEHKNLKVIGFNGQKPEKLHDKYFSRKQGIRYVSLPSTSGANTSIGFEGICDKWKKILQKM